MLEDCKNTLFTYLRMLTYILKFSLDIIKFLRPQVNQRSKYLQVLGQIGMILPSPMTRIRIRFTWKPNESHKTIKKSLSNPSVIRVHFRGTGPQSVQINLLNEKIKYCYITVVGIFTGTQIFVLVSIPKDTFNLLEKKWDTWDVLPTFPLFQFTIIGKKNLYVLFLVVEINIRCNNIPFESQKPRWLMLIIPKVSSPHMSFHTDLNLVVVSETPKIHGA